MERFLKGHKPGDLIRDSVTSTEFHSSVKYFYQVVNTRLYRLHREKGLDKESVYIVFDVNEEEEEKKNIIPITHQ